MHDTLQPNTWQGATHNHMVTIKIWIYNRISRVTWVSSVRRLQIWLKNFYRWSKKWSRCEEQHYHEINTQSITKYPGFDLQLELHKRENDKVIKANLSKNVWIWKCVFHLSVMKIWASSQKSNQWSNEEGGTEPVIGVQCKKVINERIPKYRVGDNKVKGCAEPRNENKKP